ncbi:MAG TPA: tetratricopeptide repeat protein [Methyloceanibacter sp.]
MWPGPRFCLRPYGPLSPCLAALALAGVALTAPCPEAFAQQSQPPGVEELEGAPSGQAEPDLIEPDEMAPDEMTPGKPPPDQAAMPDAKKDGDEEPAPRSTEESKRDKLNLSTDNLPLSDPVERPKMLARLYDELKSAHDAHDASPITETIEELWLLSGSDTVDLLMARADRFIKESDLDLALEILDATVELAPDDAEAWHRRATVHYLQKDYELALADLRHALNIDPKHYNAINDLGAVLQALGAKKEALQAYRKALEVNPFLEDARQAVESLSREVEGQDI